MERILICCPSNLTFQWQRELRDKFEEVFKIFRGSDIRDQYGVNQWLEQKQVITSLDLAKRQDIIPSLKQAHWDLVIVDEAHRVARKNDLSPSLLLALVQTESNFRVKAESNKGARGLTQVMPYNAKRCGLHPDQLWDVSLNLACGAQILREEIDRLGSIKDALSVYNCGKRLCKQGQKYATKVLSLAKSKETKK